MTGVILLAALHPLLAASLEGRVVSDAGDPLPGITVVAYDQRLNYGTATSTNDGSWSIRQLPAGRYRLRAMPDDGSPYAGRFYPSEWDYCSSEPLALEDGATLDGLDIALPEGGRLSGRIVDLAGAPVAGAVVEAQGLETRTSLGARAAETDADGAFTIYGLDADPDMATDWRCVVAADGFPHQWIGATYDKDEADVFSIALPGAGDAADLGDAALLDGIRVSGTVYGPDGPVASGAAYVYASSQVLTASLDADGVYEADGLPPGDVLSWATVDGLATTYWPGADRPTSERVAAPDEGADVGAVDLDLPAETVLTVQFSGEGGDLSELTALLYNDEHTVGRGGPVDADGRIVIDGLWPGTYDLYVYGADGGYADGYGFEGHVLAASETVDVPLALAASLSGRLTDDAGAGVYGAYVYAYPASDPDRSYTAVSDADGAYAITGLPADHYTLRASYVNYCPADRGYVTVWWQDALTEDWAAPILLELGQAQDGVDLHLPDDDDHDGMGDAWERDNGLDPAHDDATADPDGDGFSNLEEYQLGTDPTSGQSALGGCGGCASAPGSGWGAGALLAALLLRRGQPSRRGRKSHAAEGTGTP